MVYAVCTSGLGNKIATLVGGIYWSKVNKCDLKIVWTPDNECGCTFDNLFSSYSDAVISMEQFQSEIQHVNNTLVAGFRQQALGLATYSLIKQNIEKPAANAFINLYDPNTLNELNTNEKTLVYNNIEIPNYINLQEITDILLSLQIQKNILLKVENFINIKNINKNVNGLLLRKTDAQYIFKKLKEVDYYLEIKNNPHKTYFITSDDYETEFKFKQLPNVICYPKLKFVDFNNGVVHRSKQSVIDAFICLLILSKTTIKPVSNNSSFYKTALLYQNVNF
jgi:hypothetical protein